MILFFFKARQSKGPVNDNSVFDTIIGDQGAVGYDGENDSKNQRLIKILLREQIIEMIRGNRRNIAQS